MLETASFTFIHKEIVETLFAEPVALKSSIFPSPHPLELIHGSGTTSTPTDKKKGVNLTLQAQILHPN